ncbi:hypothetical protein HPP92_027849 [Vanilla planifolia]|uniref:Uncharacterized protein n=1 Tax=Vanilla planifolia TaxID=51239 RepID=A0A835PAY1_VANPL|nr:hypothetical protein HPP92_027849 [Vanilla planifolia]
MASKRLELGVVSMVSESRSQCGPDGKREIRVGSTLLLWGEEHRKCFAVDGAIDKPPPTCCPNGEATVSKRLELRNR